MQPSALVVMSLGTLALAFTGYLTSGVAVALTRHKTDLCNDRNPMVM